jgi:hypothetical protein
LSLLAQYSNICNLLQTIVSKEEEELAVNCLSAIHGSIKIVYGQVSLTCTLHSLHSQANHVSKRDITPILQSHTNLWHQLFYPHLIGVRRLTHEVLIQLERIIHLLLPTIKYKKFRVPPRTNKPSVLEQIVYQPVRILDPYILALRCNYYYPIAPEDLRMAEDTQMENQTEESSPKQSPKCSSPQAKHPITVESSLAAIAELIKEVEADDPPIEVAAPPTILKTDKKYHTHRFTIYRKHTYPTPGAPPNQLALFNSFVKSIKSADQTAKIQPIRSDAKIYPLSTTDQINSLEQVGLYNYFKPYKRSQKTISGDFHVSTKLSFEDLKDHPAFNTWLMHNGYNVLYNACQTADMVKIGFLTRVRGFTFRGDLQEYIMGSEEWKATPFHFRSYFDAFTVRNKTAHVLMIDIDRPNIETAILFFQQWYNGTLTNSPNKLPYMFWPLFKKSYTDEERLKIITDHSHHVGSDNVIGLTGLQPLDTLVKLANGMYTTIRLLLLSIPTPGTSTGQLFLQVERQTTNEWLLCCFHQHDTAKVMIRLSTLEDSLRKCVHQDSIPHLFTSADGITFTNQVAPLIKGRNRLPRMEAPAYTANYVNKSMQKLYTPPAKRQATAMNVETTIEVAQTAQTARTSPTTYAVAVTPTIPVTPCITTILPDTSENKAVRELQATTMEHSSTLAELRKCYTTLATTQQQLANSMTTLNTDMNTKFSELVNTNLKFHERFNDMSAAIENLRTSSPTRPVKFYKGNPCHTDTIHYQG